jgi:Mn2+/Fe2+ NRAMP family transporter
MGAVGSALSAIAGGCGFGDGMPAAQGKHDKPVKTDPIRRFIGGLGPGLITGASDDDPSGIGTYSQAGAQLGFSIGWTMLLTYPLMVAIQEISARLGRTTGHGIAGNLCRHYPSWLLRIIVTLLFIANAINIGADLSAMADASNLLMGGPGFLYVAVFATICVTGIVFTSYDRYVTVLKWLTWSLFTYVE